MSNGTKVLKLNMSKMGVTIGAIWGVNLLLMALMSMFFGVGEPIIVQLGSLYIGYAASIVGGLTGMVLGFIHGYVLGIFGNYAINLLVK